VARNQDLNSSIRDDLLSLIALKVDEPHKILPQIKPVLLTGDVLSVWEALVDNLVILKDGNTWKLNPAQPDCPWSVNTDHWDLIALDRFPKTPTISQVAADLGRDAELWRTNDLIKSPAPTKISLTVEFPDGRSFHTHKTFAPWGPPAKMRDPRALTRLDAQVIPKEMPRGSKRPTTQTPTSGSPTTK